jgi:predicted transcriptional regulator
VLVIGENGTILKTPLMEKANMNSARLKMYLNWLGLNDLIKIDGQKITLTENGMRFRLRCLKLIEA